MISGYNEYFPNLKKGFWLSGTYNKGLIDLTKMSRVFCIASFIHYNKRNIVGYTAHQLSEQLANNYNLFTNISFL